MSALKRACFAIFAKQATHFLRGPQLALRRASDTFAISNSCLEPFGTFAISLKIGMQMFQIANIMFPSCLEVNCAVDVRKRSR
jgi:hypothetical protein